MIIDNLNNVYQNFGKEVYSYLRQIEKLLSQKIRDEGITKFSTNSGEYDIRKITSIEFYEVYFGDKIHQLFSPQGCEINGTLKIVADTYVGSDKNAYTAHTYLVDFNPVRINYLYDNECFKLGKEFEIKSFRKV